MKNNPYSQLINIMREQGNKEQNPEVKIAKVTNISDTNISIEVDGLVVDKDNIYISDYLLKGYRREIKTDNTIDLVGNTNSVNINNAIHGHKLTGLMINHSVVYTKDTLETNDLVAVIPVADRQTYIILSRVVRYGE